MARISQKERYRQSLIKYAMSHKFYSLEDFAKQLVVHNRKYNNLPMGPLGWKFPREVMARSLGSM